MEKKKRNYPKKILMCKIHTHIRIFTMIWYVIKFIYNLSQSLSDLYFETFQFSSVQSLSRVRLFETP